MIYLDNSATTRPDDAVIAAMARCMSEGFYNPSSLYAPSMGVEQEITAVKEGIARSLGSKGLKVYFTSGGTESNNTVLNGVLRKDRPVHIITTAMEHPSILSCAKHLEGSGVEVTYLPVSGEGRVSPDALAGAIRENTALVSIMQVNNETGAVQDLPALTKVVHAADPRILFHSDGVQGYMRVPIDLLTAGVDLYSLSSHKIHGPKGIGALVMNPKARLKPFLYGGEQQEEMRPGTENVPGIIGLGKAREVFAARSAENIAGMREAKMAFLHALGDCLDDWHVNGPAPEDAAPHIVNIALDGVRGEVVLHSLEEHEIYVSTGSACSSHKKSASHALTAHGISPERALSSIRISLCPMITVEDMQMTAETLAQVVKHLRKFRRK